MKKALDGALAGEHIETVLETHGRFYQLLANPVKVTGKTYGAVIMVWDITEKNAAEQMRREFSANVSHELKTPLMSISGYAELIENGMVQPADIPWNRLQDPSGSQSTYCIGTGYYPVIKTGRRNQSDAGRSCGSL